MRYESAPVTASHVSVTCPGTDVSALTPSGGFAGGPAAALLARQMAAKTPRIPRLQTMVPPRLGDSTMTRKREPGCLMHPAPEAGGWAQPAGVRSTRTPPP